MQPLKDIFFIKEYSAVRSPFSARLSLLPSWSHLTGRLPSISSSTLTRQRWCVCQTRSHSLNFCTSQRIISHSVSRCKTLIADHISTTDIRKIKPFPSNYATVNLSLACFTALDSTTWNCTVTAVGRSKANKNQKSSCLIYMHYLKSNCEC